MKDEVPPMLAEAHGRNVDATGDASVGLANSGIANEDEKPEAKPDKCQIGLHTFKCF